MRFWVRWMGVCEVVKLVTVRGGEALQRGPVVVVANHPSLIDTPILLSVMPQGDFIVNAALGRQPGAARLRRRAPTICASSTAP